MSEFVFFYPKQNVAEEKNDISLVAGNTMHKHAVHLKSGKNRISHSIW